MPYIARLEKAGIPTVAVDYQDQEYIIKQTALANGVPNIRYVRASRMVKGPEDADAIVDSVIDALTRPLTEEEQKGGRWTPPEQSRVLFEGTLGEAQDFYQQTEYIASTTNAPIAVYTDGYPIIVPTEERVQEMLKGTSHKPDEVITYQSDRGGMPPVKKGDAVKFQPMNWTATVEKVAINAVMAGCKSEYLPVVLAIAESGCATGTTVFFGQWACVSGPIAKEIGMNSGCGMLDPGNPANTTIGRAYQLMARNLGGAVTGVNRMNSIGSPINRGGLCFAENADALPPGWKGLNEEHGFKKNESVVMVQTFASGFITGAHHTPAGYRQLQKAGKGGISRKLGLEGVPGPHNWLDYILPSFFTYRSGGWTLIMVPEMAQHLYELGFKSKDEVYEWIWKRSFEPMKEYRKRQPLDLMTNGWTTIEKSSGKPWNELPDDYIVPVAGEDPFNNCIIVGGGQEEVCEQLDGRRGIAGASPIYSIDAWR